MTDGTPTRADAAEPEREQRDPPHIADRIERGGIGHMTVAEAVSHPDARILPRVGESAAGENHALDEFAED